LGRIARFRCKSSCALDIEKDIEIDIEILRQIKIVSERQLVLATEFMAINSMKNGKREVKTADSEDTNQ